MPTQQVTVFGFFIKYGTYNGGVTSKEIDTIITCNDIHSQKKERWR